MQRAVHRQDGWLQSYTAQEGTLSPRHLPLSSPLRWKPSAKKMQGKRVRGKGEGGRGEGGRKEKEGRDRKEGEREGGRRVREGVLFGDWIIQSLFPTHRLCGV